ncbi:MAG: hypothetical protein ACUZ8E_07285 [Candidatus Anammoxibacter sp.]
MKKLLSLILFLSFSLVGFSQADKKVFGKLTVTDTIKSEVGYKFLDGSFQSSAADGTMIGEITMYFGDIAIFPTATHALCNGANGTPDLRGKFVRAWSDGVGQEYAESPARRNNNQSASTQRPIVSFVTNATGLHTHGQTNGKGNGRWLQGGNDETGSDADLYQGASTGNVKLWWDVSIASDGNHSHNITGGGDIETRPVNYTLAFIMRIAN